MIWTFLQIVAYDKCTKITKIQKIQTHFTKEQHYNMYFIFKNSSTLFHHLTDLRLDTILNLSCMKTRLWGIDLQSLQWHALNKDPNKGSKRFFYIYQTLLSKATYIAFNYSFTFDQLLLSLGIEPMILALLAPCSTIWATGKVQQCPVLVPQRTFQWTVLKRTIFS